MRLAAWIKAPMLTLSVAVALTCNAAEHPRELVPSTKNDSRIAAALKDISSARIRASITALVGFGTRSTLSAQDPTAIAAGRGIGAAREWIKTQFEQYSKDCGGCLEVKTDAFTQQPAERFLHPTNITNVFDSPMVLVGKPSLPAKTLVACTS